MLAVAGIIVAALILIAFASHYDKKPQINQADPKDNATAAALGGQIGWPTPQWPEQHKAQLGPEKENGRHDNPIHGVISGFHFVSYRTQWTWQPGGTAAVFTYYATADAILGISQNLPDLEIISENGNWHASVNGHTLDASKFTIGDADFDARWAVYSSAARQAQLLLTTQVKEVLAVLDQTVGGLRLRVHSGALHAWFKAKDDVRTQHQAYLRYLQTLSVLARILNASAPEPQPDRY